MSGVTPLVDTLLATRLGQRVDLVPLKAQVEIAGPGAVADVEKVSNDVRLPSREALQRELGPGLVGRGGAAPDFTQGRAVTLSAAARTVSALLNLPVGTTPAVRGRAPLQPDMRAPLVPQLTATLARTVAESGLFYESHLQQFAAGQRTLAQLAREPQAGLALPAAARAAAPGAGSAQAAATALLFSTAATSAAQADANLPPAATANLPGTAAALPPVPLGTLETSAPPAPGMAAPDAAGPGAPAPASHAAAPTGKAGPPEAAGPATTYGPSGLPEPAPASPHDFSLQDVGTPASDTASAGAARAGHAAVAIHPDAVGLVRQQLDMLALPVFRWSGEGWPGIPMDWEIRQERDGQEGREGRDNKQEGHAAGAPEAAPAAWTTRMTLKLPRLGTVDVRLGLAGTALQLSLDASREGTVAVLSQAGAELSRRLGAVGLELTDLRIGGAVPKAGAADTGASSDAA